MMRFSLIHLLFFIGMTLACHGGRMLRSGGLSCYEKDWIVKKHNEKRSEVAIGSVKNQPPAQNMMEMCWDEELADQAQRWADNCLYEHDKGRIHSLFYVGQNLYRSWTSAYYDHIGTGPDFDRAINSWFNEVNIYGYDGRFRKETGHYSQLIWGDTYLVGCGFSCYTNGSTYTKLYVCNYGPGGNFARSPYVYGLPDCHRHGLFPSINYHGLCGVVVQLVIEAVNKGKVCRAESSVEQTVSTESKDQTPIICLFVLLLSIIES